MGPGDRASDASNAVVSSSAASSSTPHSVDASKVVPSIDLSPFSRKDLDMLIMNYLQTEGFREAADNFKSEAQIDLGGNIGSMDERIKIRSAIQK
jgi:hypothetical protein